MSNERTPPRTGISDILAVGFGTTVAMWACGYVCRQPDALAPNWLLLALMLACLFGGGVYAGRFTRRGARGGMWACLLAGLLNLMILGSLLASPKTNSVVPSAMWWVPGSFLVAALLGLIGGAIGRSFRRDGAEERNWLSAWVGVLVVATLLLLIIGGMVTGYEAGLSVVDWPNSFGYNMFLYPLSRMTGAIYFEHSHRLTGSLVGLTTLALAIYVQKNERRAWLRKFAWLMLLVVVVQGVLGGLRVTGRFTMSASPDDTAPSIALAMIHGTLGQLFLAMAMAMRVFTSSAWRGEPQQTHAVSAATDRSFSIILVVLLLIQLVLGTLVRHIDSGLMVHISMAGIVVLAILNAGVRAWGLYAQQPRLQRLGRTLMILAGVQVLLGVSALVVVSMSKDMSPKPWWDAIVTTSHQIVGAIILATAVALMLWTRRLLVPAEHQETAAVG